MPAANNRCPGLKIVQDMPLPRDCAKMELELFDKQTTIHFASGEVISNSLAAKFYYEVFPEVLPAAAAKMAEVPAGVFQIEMRKALRKNCAYYNDRVATGVVKLKNSDKIKPYFGSPSNIDIGNKEDNSVLNESNDFYVDSADDGTRSVSQLTMSPSVADVRSSSVAPGCSPYVSAPRSSPFVDTEEEEQEDIITSVRKVEAVKFGDTEKQLQNARIQITNGR